MLGNPKILEKRLVQHKGDIKARRNPNGQSAVLSHFLSTGQMPNFEKARVLSTEHLWSRHNTPESLHILSENSYNLRREHCRKRNIDRAAVSSSRQGHARTADNDT